jgi:hypothetical protein
MKKQYEGVLCLSIRATVDDVAYRMATGFDACGIEHIADIWAVIAQAAERESAGHEYARTKLAAAVPHGFVFERSRPS